MRVILHRGGHGPDGERYEPSPDPQDVHPEFATMMLGRGDSHATLPTDEQLRPAPGAPAKRSTRKQSARTAPVDTDAEE